MTARLRRLKEICRALPQIYSGHQYQLIRPGVKFFGTHLNPLQSWTNINTSFEPGVTFRFSTVPETSREPIPQIDLLSFIQSTLYELEGPSHCWLNRVEDGKDFGRRDKIFLVLVGAPLEDFLLSGSGPVNMFEKAKALQQRYPSIHVMGFLSSSSIFSDAVSTRLLEIIMKECITFPILLSNKNFSKITDGACYIICKDFKSPLLLHQWDVDIKIIDKAIKELSMQHNESSRSVHDLKSTWVKQTDVIKEPFFCFTLRNLLLHFPGCISVDEAGNRLFLSDINHHRIIIFDGNGKILDCIGSSPGFEDGEFESAKLARPAASFYHASEGCLYFVDSENHAIRKADMETRVLETIYPTSNISKQNYSIWSWIMDKLWMKRDVETIPEGYNSESFLFPWHLMKSSDSDLFILNRSFETLWIVDLASGSIKEVVKGFPKILEICGGMIVEKLSILKQMPRDWLQQQVDSCCSLEEIPYAGLMSSVATFQHHIVICDTVGQMVLKVCSETGLGSSFQFSNFGILGLPYWLTFSLEKVYAVDNVLSWVHTDHIQNFSLLPGRIDIKLNVNIPEDMELVEPLREGCIWRQARGAATEVSGSENGVASAEKVGASQQWYDELDNLAFSTPELDFSAIEVNEATDGKVQEGSICIDCTVNTSPGTSEVIIHAALYLKMKRNPDYCRELREKIAARIVDVLNPKSSERMGKDASMNLLLKANTDLGELIFMKPLCVRLMIDSLDHPKADNYLKEIILTDSKIDVDVLL